MERNSTALYVSCPDDTYSLEHKFDSLLCIPLKYDFVCFLQVSGSTTRELSGQAQGLVTKLGFPPYYAHRHEWKLVSVLIGGNNLCRNCFQPSAVDLVIMIQEIRDALLKLRNAYDRWVINLIGMFKVCSACFSAFLLLKERLS
jgi:hypothetical protein